MNCNAWKLTRVEPREKPRTDWPARWQAAGDSVNWQGALKNEFIALKTSPIWRALGSGVGGFDDATKSDSPPFAINSGMGWIGVDFQPEQKVVNRKLSLTNEKGQPSMNQPNKVNLILLIAQKFTDEMCATVLERFNNHPRTIANKLANEALNWDEDLHPRQNDGKFAPKGQGSVRDDYSREELSDLAAKIRDNDKIAKRLAGRKSPGYTAEEYERLELARSRKEDPEFGSRVSPRGLEPTAATAEKIKRLERIEKLRQLDEEDERQALRATHNQRAKRYNDMADEVDELEEAYGERDNLDKLKWPSTDKGKADRKRYKKLKREIAKLEKQIDWNLVDDEDADDSMRTLDDPKYRPDDPPSRTDKAADEADREMFREWTKNIPREKWTKDMQAEYKRLFGKR